MTSPSHIAATGIRFQRCLATKAQPSDIDDPADREALEFVFFGRFGTLPLPSEKEFRDAGMTAAAANFPLDGAEFLWTCIANGIAPDRAPPAYWYAPNDETRRRLRAHVEQYRIPGFEWP